MERTLFLLAGLGCASTLAAQFTGGSADGQVSASIAQSTCAIPAQVFFGGVGVGAADVALAQSACAIPDQVFTGGNADGQASGTLAQSTCAIPDQVFTGGNADGQASGTLAQSTCAIPDQVFAGGSADGQASGTLAQSTCAIPDQVFAGGNADGQAAGTLAQSACAIPDQVFTGGRADGHSNVSLTQATCTVTDQVFFGGRADGSNSRVLKQNDCLILLPVELLFFTAECIDQGVRLTWATATEKDNDHFTVERSRDGLHFDALGDVPGAGNSTGTLHYALIDVDHPDGGAYYRLKQTDLDGTVHYHSVVYIRCDRSMAVAPVVSPNPTDGPFRITGLTPGQQIIIANSSGGTVLELRVLETSMDLSLAGEACGTYLLIVRGSRGEGSAQRIVLQR